MSRKRSRHAPPEPLAISVPRPAHRTEPTGSSRRDLTQAPTPMPIPGNDPYGDNSAPRDRYVSQGQPNPMFLPGDPLRPVPGLDDTSLPIPRPRQYQYPVGTNIVPAPRHEEQVSFEELRNLAMLYEGCQLCEKAIARVIRRLDMQIQPRAEFLEPGEDALSPRWRATGRAMAEWFSEPDHRGTGFHDWLVAAMRDNLQLDAVAIFHRRDRAGRLHGLELVAGETIAALVDVGGRRPLPPAPAFAQVLYGVVASLWRADELDYLVEHPRTTSHYGTSPVESILLRVNNALRKAHYDLTRWTDGATPAGVMHARDPCLVGMKADDLQALQELWNAVLAGNSAYRVRTQFVPPGFEFTSLQQDQVATDFDRWLLNITAAAYGLTMDELGFTETSNRSVGDSQERVVYRNAVAPRASFFANYLNRIIRRYHGTDIGPRATSMSLPNRPTRKPFTWDARYHVTWSGIEEPEDFNAKVGSAAEMVKSGILQVDEARRWLKLPREILNPDTGTKGAPTDAKDASRVVSASSALFAGRARPPGGPDPYPGEGQSPEAPPQDEEPEDDNPWDWIKTIYDIVENQDPLGTALGLHDTGPPPVIGPDGKPIPTAPPLPPGWNDPANPNALAPPDAAGEGDTSSPGPSTGVDDSWNDPTLDPANALDPQETGTFHPNLPEDFWDFIAHGGPFSLPQPDPGTDSDEEWDHDDDDGDDALEDLWYGHHWAAKAKVQRVDQLKREVLVRATTERVVEGIQFTYEASVKAFKAWSGAVREFPKQTIVGHKVRVLPRPQARAIDVVLTISKGAPDTWEKILDGTLTGVDIIGEEVQTQKVPNNVIQVTSYRLVFLALTDQPKNPDTVIHVIR